VSGLIGAPPQAHAATGCIGEACEGLDPVTTGCDNDAVVLDETTFDTLLDARLYYSADCQATWAKVTLGGSSTFIQYGALFYVPPLGGTEQALSAGSLVARGDTGYSAMAYYGDSVKACFTSIGDKYDPSPEAWTQGGSGACTNWN
jgi:hypothetical protein